MMLTVGMSRATGIRRCITALGVVVVCVAAFDAPADALDHEILQWHPGSCDAPQPIIRAERFKNNDLGIESSDFFGQHAAFGSVVAYFCGDDVDLRREFAKTFEKYLVHQHDGIFPRSTRPQIGNCTIHTYRTPYEYGQPEFQQWLSEHTDKTDMFEPAARRFNDYRGPVLSPWTAGSETCDDAFLKSTFGFAAYPTGRSMVLVNDNRFNPMRWVGPVNEVHHHEQPSLCLTLEARDGQWERTAQVLQDFMAGKRDRYIILDYDVELAVEDFRAELGEYTVWDFYGQYDLNQEPRGIVSQTHRDTWDACHGKLFQGKQFTPAQKTLYLSWLEARLINVNVQCSLMVNFRQREGVFRLSEFMIAAKNQTARPWNLTPCPVVNCYAVDGGGAYNFAWYRTSIDMLRDERFTGNDPSLTPVLREGDSFVAIPDGGLPRTRLRGSIDLTRFYALSRQMGCFPGQKCQAGDAWVGFEGDDPRLSDPEERHGIEWVGFIFENHGPFRVQATIHGLNVREIGS
jgi:hypothetical protein